MSDLQQAIENEMVRFVDLAADLDSVGMLDAADPESWPEFLQERRQVIDAANKVAGFDLDRAERKWWCRLWNQYSRDRSDACDSPEHWEQGCGWVLVAPESEKERNDDEQ